MVTVEALRPGDDPPEDKDWVMIERATEGYFVTAYLLSGGEVQFIHADPLPTFLMAMDLAGKFALQHGLRTIYTRGVPS